MTAGFSRAAGRSNAVEKAARTIPIGTTPLRELPEPSLPKAGRREKLLPPAAFPDAALFSPESWDSRRAPDERLVSGLSESRLVRTALRRRVPQSSGGAVAQWQSARATGRSGVRFPSASPNRLAQW